MDDWVDSDEEDDADSDEGDDEEKKESKKKNKSTYRALCTQLAPYKFNCH